MLLFVWYSLDTIAAVGCCFFLLLLVATVVLGSRDRSGGLKHTECEADLVLVLYDYCAGCADSVGCCLVYLPLAVFCYFFACYCCFFAAVCLLLFMCMCNLYVAVFWLLLVDIVWWTLITRRARSGPCIV